MDGVEDQPSKDSVDSIFKHLESNGWIHKQYKDLQEYMNDADYFQEEKMD